MSDDKSFKKLCAVCREKADVYNKIELYTCKKHTLDDTFLMLGDEIRQKRRAR